MLTRTTSNSCKRPSTAFPSIALNQPPARSSASASTKATTPRTFASSFDAGTTNLTSNRAGRKKRRGSAILASRRADGLLSERILGSTVFAGCSLVGKRRPTTTLPSYTSPLYGQRSALRVFWDRLLMCLLFRPGGNVAKALEPSAGNRSPATCYPLARTNRPQDIIRIPKYCVPEMPVRNIKASAICEHRNPPPTAKPVATFTFMTE